MTGSTPLEHKNVGPRHVTRRFRHFRHVMQEINDPLRMRCGSENRPLFVPQYLD
jgi:hypothetical protein